jgi:hypothetical protein
VTSITTTPENPCKQPNVKTSFQFAAKSPVNTYIFTSGWLIGLHIELARAEDPAFNWLVEQAGGWWWWPDDAADVSFQAGSLVELRGVRGR